MLNSSLVRVGVTLSTLALTGCLGFQRVTDPTRFYVLSPVSIDAAAEAPGSDKLAVGIGRVEIPSYLLDRRIAVRQGSNQISYLEYHRWAERLDKGLQRVLAANLSALLPSDRVLVSPWSRDEVQVELLVSFERFDIDDGGHVTLEAQWRAASTENGETWRSDHVRITRPSPALPADPDRAVGALSDALADLSRQLTAALQNLPSTAAKARGPSR